MNDPIWMKRLTVGIILMMVAISVVPVLSGRYGAQDASLHHVQSSIDWWPMFHHDAVHSGFSTSVAPTSNHVAWTFQTDLQILSCPIVVDGKVFFGSNHKYYCLDAKTGVELWECPTSGWAEGNPAYENGFVYLVSRDQYGLNTVFCVNADTGQYVWNFTDCYWPFNPIVVGGILYFSSLDGYVRCLDALDGSLIWSYFTGIEGGVNTPALSDGKVYFGAGNGRMYCVNAANGNLLWTYKTNGNIMESASIDGGKIYFGSGDYELYCLDADTGVALWNYTTGFVVDSTPALAYGNVFFGSRDCTLYCLNADTGVYQWSYGADDEIDSSPAIADGKVYVGSDDSKVYCLNAQTGTKLWEYQTGSFVMSSPAIANGNVYIGSYDAKLYCFGGVLVANFTWTPSNPRHGQLIAFNASSSFDSISTITTYEWDWDHNGVYDESSPVPTTTHLWSTPGSYPVTLRVTNTSGQTATVTKTIIVGNQAPSMPTISGPHQGKRWTTTTYNCTTIDPDGDNLSYYIDWGDGKNTGWIGPYASGETITQSHLWLKKGTFTIKVKAKDSFGLASDWGNLNVTMPQPYEPSHFPFLAWLFDRCPQAFPILRHLFGF